MHADDPDPRSQLHIIPVVIPMILARHAGIAVQRSFKMASNGRVGLRSGSPSFLVVGLSLVIIVLLYSYWSVSSRNSILLRDQSFLQDRLRSLTSQKIAAEKKKSSAMAQVANMEKTKRQLEGNIMSSSKEKSELEIKVKDLEERLKQEKTKLTKLQSEQVKTKAELQKLKSNIDSTAEKMKGLTGKSNILMENHNKLKVQLVEKTDKLFKVQNEWEICKVKLNKLKEEKSEEIKKGDAETKQGKTTNDFKHGLNKLKKQMILQATGQAEKGKPVFTTKTRVQAGNGLQPGQKLNAVKTNSTVSTKSTGEATVSNSTQSGNDTSKVTVGNRTMIITTPSTMASTDSNNVDTVTPPLKDNTNDPEHIEHIEGEESDDPHNQDENDSHGNPARARPIGSKYQRRQTNGE